jgi:hypothetical protein
MRRSESTTLGLLARHHVSEREHHFTERPEWDYGVGSPYQRAGAAILTYYM